MLCRLHRFCLLILGDRKKIRFILINVYFHSYPQIFWLFLFAVSVSAINFFIEQYREIPLTSQLLQLHRVMFSVTSGSSFSLLLPCFWLHCTSLYLSESRLACVSCPFNHQNLPTNSAPRFHSPPSNLHPPGIITSVILFYVTVLMNGIPFTWLCSHFFYIS